jgi:DNA-directed RNA polymerase subunit L
MGFKNFKKKDNKITFNVKNTDVSILNSIRRIILSDIPNVAFDFKPYDFQEKKINIIENTCSLHNEIILQRLSMIPLKFDEDEINNFEPNKYKFVLKKINNSSKMMDVTTEDIEIFDENDKKYNNKFIRKIFPKNKISGNFILITKLKPNLFNKDNGDVLEINMIATKSTAKDYAGFGYVSQCVYFNVIDEKLADEELKKILEKNKELSKKEITNLKNEFNTLDKYRHFRKNEYDEPNYFEFNIESESRVSPEFLVFKGMLIIKNRIETIVANLIDSKIKIDKVESDNDKTSSLESTNFYSFEIENEKHTLGNLIQSLFYNEFIRNGNKKIIEYIGYKSPHPLEEILILKIKFNEDIKENQISKVVIEGLVNIQTDMDDLIKKWIDISKLDKKIIEISEYI